MASFTGVGDNVTLEVAKRDTTVDIDISGTYDMTILFQRRVGAPGSGAWETLKTFSTEDATEAEQYVTEKDKEELRLIVDVDGGGTATATLADNEDATLLTYKDSAGTTHYTLRESGIEFSGGVRPGTVTLTASTTLDDTYVGKTIFLSSATGLTITLPSSTGSGDEYLFVVATTLSSNDYIISCDADDGAFAGGVWVATDENGALFPSDQTANDLITMNGSTTGGVVGSWVKVKDVATDVWQVTGSLISTGNEATPFSGT